MRAIKIIALLLPLLLFSGCKQSQQIENIAFAIIFGVDILEDNTIELTVQIPNVNGSSGEGSGQSEEGSDYLIASAKGATYSNALELLRVSLPRNLNLTQVKLLVVSEKLAKDERFGDILDAITDQLYNATYFAVSMGSAKDIVSEQTSVIGTRISIGLVAMFEHYLSRGYITDTSLADFYYTQVADYSDPVAIYTAASEPSETVPKEGLATETFPDDLPAESENKTKYLGTALFRNGLMVGQLDGLQTCFANLLSGNCELFDYSIDETPITLQSMSTPGIKFEGLGSENLLIRIDLDLSATSLVSIPNKNVLEEMIEKEILDLLNHCQSLEIEPFGFANIAAAHFLTFKDWQEYSWQIQFSKAEIDIDIDISISSS